MTIYSNNSDFFKPNRQIWQEAEPGGDVDTDTDSDTDTDLDADTDYEVEPKSAEEISDAEQVIEITKQAKHECKSAQKAICSLQKDEVWDAKKINRLRKFIDKLDYVFFVKGEDEEKLDYTADRLKRLEEQLNMELIISEFLKSKSANIKTYADWQKDKYPNLNDHIIFKYKDKSKKRFFLEKSSRGLPVLQSNYSEEAKEGSIDDSIQEYLQNFDKWEREVPSESEMEARLEAMEDHFLDHISSLSTPDAAYRELRTKVPTLPPSLLKDLSEPLASIADIYAKEGAIDEQEIADTYGIQIKDVLKKHFGENYRERMSPEELQDLNLIEEMFGMG